MLLSGRLREDVLDTSSETHDSRRGRSDVKPFQFEHYVEGDLNVYRHLAMKSLLEHPWRPPEMEGQAPPQWWVYGAYGDTYAVPLSFAWRMVRHLEVYAIPNYWWTGGYAGTPPPRPTLVDWEYDVFAEEEARGIPTFRDNGFVHARSASPLDVPVEWTSSFDAPLEGKAAVFPVRDWLELVKLHISLRCDAQAELTIFGMQAGRGRALVDALQARKRPLLVDLLLPGEIFVDVVTPEDLGYLECILLKAPDDLETVVSDTAGAVVRAFHAYERAIGRVTDLDEYIAMLTATATGDPA